MSAGALPIEIEEPGKLPPERFRDSSQVWELCQHMIGNDDKLSKARAAIEHLWNGFATYPLDFLKKKHQGWRNRTNYLGLKGVCDTMETAIFNLDVEVPAAIDIGIDMGKDYSKDQVQEWERKISRHFTWMVLHQWNDSDFHILGRIHEMVLHGIGYHLHREPDKWIPRTPRSGNVLFPDDCPINFNEDGEYFMVRDFVTGVQAYNFIRNEKAARKLGWNPDKVWEWMVKVSKSSESGRDDPQQLQRLYKQGDTGASTSRRSGGWLNWLYVREYSDQDSKDISLYCVGEREELGDYLFRARYYLKDWPLHIFPYDTGNGTIQSVRGAGLRFKVFFEMQNRLFNKMADQVLVSGTIPLTQTVTNIDPDKLKLTMMGMFSIIPQGLAVAPGIQFPNLSTGGLALSKEFDQMMVRNNQSYLPQEPERADRQTGVEYLMRSQNMSQVGKGTNNFYYRNLTGHYSYILNIAKSKKSHVGNSESATLAKKFYERCIADDIPPEAFDHIEEVSAVRSIGAGSAAARLTALKQLFELVYPNAPEAKKIALEYDLASALVTYSQADRYSRTLDDQEIPNSDDSLAVVENDVLSQGGEALAASGQDQVRHAARHLDKGDEIKQSIENEQTPGEQALPAIMAILRHAGQHLDFLSKNPLKKREFGQLEKQFNLLAQFAKHLQAVVEQEQEAAQTQGTPEQQLSEKGQIGMFSAQQDAQRKDWKVARDEQRKDTKFGLTERRNDLSSASKIRRANLLTNGARA